MLQYNYANEPRIKQTLVIEKLQNAILLIIYDISTV